MIVKLKTHRLRTVAQVRAFLKGTAELDVQVVARAAAYDFTTGTLSRLGYLRPSNIDASKHAWAILSLLVKRMTAIIQHEPCPLGQNDSEWIDHTDHDRQGIDPSRGVETARVCAVCC